MAIPEWRVLCSDARNLGIPDKSVHMIALSVPYWGLRKYLDSDLEIGREKTLEQWLDNLVQCGREWRRVLRDDGTLWVNCGDSYAANRGSGAKSVGKKQATNTGSLMGKLTVPDGLKTKDLIGLPWRLAFALQADGWRLRQAIVWAKGVDWMEQERVAQEDIRRALAEVQKYAETSFFGLSGDLSAALKKADKALDRLLMAGAVMPESVKDRCTQSYEMVFMFSKGRRYYYDLHAISVPCRCQEQGSASSSHTALAQGGHHGKTSIFHQKWVNDGSGRNARTVWMFPTWRIGTDPKGTFIVDGEEIPHFAAWPEALVKRMIRAGTSEYGACATCGAPFVRIVEKGLTRHNGHTASEYEEGSTAKRLALLRQAARERGEEYRNQAHTVAWHPSCTCHGEQVGAMVRCQACDGTGVEKTSQQRTSSHFPEEDRRKSGKRGRHPGGDLSSNSMEYTGDPCPECEGEGVVTGAVWPDEVLKKWPIIPAVVLDPMVGSGATMRAALSLGRSAIGNDLSPQYVKLARARCQAFPGDVPTKKKTKEVEKEPELPLFAGESERRQDG